MIYLRGFGTQVWKICGQFQSQKPRNVSQTFSRTVKRMQWCCINHWNFKMWWFTVIVVSKVSNFRIIEFFLWGYVRVAWKCLLENWFTNVHFRSWTFNLDCCIFNNNFSVSADHKKFYSVHAVNWTRMIIRHTHGSNARKIIFCGVWVAMSSEKKCFAFCFNFLILSLLKWRFASHLKLLVDHVHGCRIHRPTSSENICFDCWLHQTWKIFINFQVIYNVSGYCPLTNNSWYLHCLTEIDRTTI